MPNPSTATGAIAMIKRGLEKLLSEFTYDAIWDATKAMFFKVTTVGTEQKITGVKTSTVKTMAPKWLKRVVVPLYNTLLYDPRIDATERRKLSLLTQDPQTLGGATVPNTGLCENQTAEFMLHVVEMAFGNLNDDGAHDTASANLNAAIALLKDFAAIVDPADPVNGNPVAEMIRRADAQNLIKNENEYTIARIERQLGRSFDSFWEFVRGVIAWAADNRAQAIALLPADFLRVVDSIRTWNARLPFIATGAVIAYLAVHIGLAFMFGKPYQHPANSLWTVLALLGSYCFLWNRTGLLGTGALLLYEVEWGPAKAVIKGIQKVSIGALLAGIYFSFVPQNAPLFWFGTFLVIMFVTLYLVAGGGVDIQKWRKVGIGGIVLAILLVFGSSFLSQTPAAVAANGFPGFWDDFPLPGGPLLPVLAVLGALALMFRGRFGNDTHSTPARNQHAGGHH